MGRCGTGAWRLQRQRSWDSLGGAEWCGLKDLDTTGERADDWKSVIARMHH